MATQESTDHRQSQQGRLDRIGDRIAELLEPRTTVEQQWVRVHVGACVIGPATRPHPFDVRCAVCGHVLLPGVGQRLEPRAHRIEHPSLVAQLEAAVAGSTAGRESSSGFESQPAANIEALNTLTVMERGARYWLEVFTGRAAEEIHHRPQELLVDVAEHLGRASAEDLRDLDHDVLQWWAHARIVTTWDLAPIKVHAPCMNCDRRGGLQVRLDPLVAVCLYCRAAWDASTIGILGEHIRIALDHRPLQLPPVPGPWPPQDDGSRVGHGRTPWHCACHGREHFPARLAADCEDRSAERASA